MILYSFFIQSLCCHYNCSRSLLLRIKWQEAKWKTSTQISYREIDLKRNILKIDSTVRCKCSFFNIHVDIIKFFQGVLLYGPPGTGKTLLARAVAHHTECTFIRVSGSELVQKFIGEGARMVRELFVMARYSNNNLIWVSLNVLKLKIIISNGCWYLHC